MEHWQSTERCWGRGTRQQTGCFNRRGEGKCVRSCAAVWVLQEVPGAETCQGSPLPCVRPVHCQREVLHGIGIFNVVSWRLLLLFPQYIVLILSRKTSSKIVPLFSKNVYFTYRKSLLYLLYLLSWDIYPVVGHRSIIRDSSCGRLYIFVPSIEIKRFGIIIAYIRIRTFNSTVTIVPFLALNVVL